MGLARQGPQAHATGAETAADAGNAFDLIQGQGHGCRPELEQVAQGRDRPVLEQGLVGREVVVTRSGRNGGMQGLGHLGAVEVVLAAGAVLHKAHELELAAVELREGLGVDRQGLAGEIGEAEARHPAGGALEGQRDQVGADADRFKDLGAVVAGQQRDADLGEDLAQAVVEGLAHVGLSLVQAQGGQLAGLDQLLGAGMREPVARGLPGQPGAHSTGAIADQAGQVMGAPALGGLDHDRGLEPQTGSQQVVVHRTGGQKRRQGRDGGIDAAGLAIQAQTIAEHKHPGAGAHGCFSLTAQAPHRDLQGSRAVDHRHQGRQRGHGQAMAAQVHQLGLVEHR